MAHDSVLLRCPYFVFLNDVPLRIILKLIYVRLMLYIYSPDTNGRIMSKIVSYTDLADICFGELHSDNISYHSDNPM